MIGVDTAGDQMVRRKRRRTAAIDGPDPVDLHVGSQIRRQRRVREMTQSALAGCLGLTFQQIQKYERGSNRVSASVLYRTSQVLGVPVNYFFDGLESAAETAAESRVDGAHMLMAMKFAKLPNPIKTVLVRLIEQIARAPDTSGLPR